jgi:hypothetical protein
MWNQMRVAWLLSKLASEDSIGVDKTLLKNNPEIASRFFPKRVGV